MTSDHQGAGSGPHDQQRPLSDEERAKLVPRAGQAPAHHRPRRARCSPTSSRSAIRSSVSRPRPPTCATSATCASPSRRVRRLVEVLESEGADDEARTYRSTLASLQLQFAAAASGAAADVDDASVAPDAADPGAEAQRAATETSAVTETAASPKAGPAAAKKPAAKKPAAKKPAGREEARCDEEAAGRREGRGAEAPEVARPAPARRRETPAVASRPSAVLGSLLPVEFGAPVGEVRVGVVTAPAARVVDQAAVEVARSAAASSSPARATVWPAGSTIMLVADELERAVAAAVSGARPRRCRSRARARRRPSPRCGAARVRTRPGRAGAGRRRAPVCARSRGSRPRSRPPGRRASRRCRRSRASAPRREPVAFAAEQVRLEVELAVAPGTQDGGRVEQRAVAQERQAGDGVHAGHLDGCLKARERGLGRARAPAMSWSSE